MKIEIINRYYDFFRLKTNYEHERIILTSNQLILGPLKRIHEKDCAQGEGGIHGI